MMGVPSGTRIWLATGATDMRKGFDGLASLVQTVLGEDPFSGHLFVFRGRRGKLIKIFWHDGLGASLYAKRLEKERFIWPATHDGVVVITPGQLGYLLEGIDWRHPQHTWRPEIAG
jgi:transposase